MTSRIPARPGAFMDLIAHLGIVTLGILIALGVGKTAEWVQHRHVVRAAEKDMAAEIRDNRKALETMMQTLPGLQSTVHDVLGRMDQRLASKKGKGKDPIFYQLAFEDASMSDTSWRTAQTVGALGYMDYPELQGYAHLYKLQENLAAAQQQALARLGELDQEVGNRKGMEENADRLRAVQRSLFGLQSAAQSLDTAYKKF